MFDMLFLVGVLLGVFFVFFGVFLVFGLFFVFLVVGFFSCCVFSWFVWVFLFLFVLLLQDGAQHGVFPASHGAILAHGPHFAPLDAGLEVKTLSEWAGNFRKPL